jgi:hypothetical protein
MGDKEVDVNPLKELDDLVPIPRVSEEPFDLLDSTSHTFDTTITLLVLNIKDRIV